MSDLVFELRTKDKLFSVSPYNYWLSENLAIYTKFNKNILKFVMLKRLKRLKNNVQIWKLMSSRLDVSWKTTSWTIRSMILVITPFLMYNGNTKNKDFFFFLKGSERNLEFLITFFNNVFLIHIFFSSKLISTIQSSQRSIFALTFPHFYWLF